MCPGPEAPSGDEAGALSATAPQPRAPERTLAPDAPDAASDDGAALERRWKGRILAGRYALGGVIGRGGMGIVFEGRHLALDRPVAVKLLRPDLARSVDAVERFHREARAAAAIGNEHIVEVLDFGLGAEGDAYLVMELLAGEDLSARVAREGPSPPAVAVAIAREVLDALEAAHDKGIIHRDLKSENIFVVAHDGGERVKVLDWGISKVLEESGERRGPITRDGVVLGTPHYMAPEQSADGALVDHRADLYALGCILFELLTGRVPFTGATAMEVLYKHNHNAPPRLSELLPPRSVDPRLDAILQRLLAKDRDDRFADARAVTAALDALDLPASPARRMLHHAAASRWGLRVVIAGFVTLGGVITDMAWRVNFDQRAAAMRPRGRPDASLRPPPPAPPRTRVEAVAPPVENPQPAVIAEDVAAATEERRDVPSATPTRVYVSPARPRPAPRAARVTRTPPAGLKANPYE
ncbi:MAG: serine/threonine-protein kinase [Polyangiales bacterium]